MHTEKEASGLWCPHSSGFNINSGSHKVVNCMGSKCMYWEWEDTKKIKRSDKGECVIKISVVDNK